MAVGKERTTSEHFRGMERERREQRQEQADDKPQRRATKQREQRHAARSVNFRGANLVCFSRVHSKGFGLAGATGAGAAAFSARAFKSARAAAEFCQACAACCIAVSTGKRTMPRDWSAHPTVFKDLSSAARIFASALLRTASRSASIAGTLTKNFTTTDMATNRIVARMKPTAAPEARLVFSSVIGCLRRLARPRDRGRCLRSRPLLPAGAGRAADTAGAR